MARLRIPWLSEAWSYDKRLSLVSSWRYHGGQGLLLSTNQICYILKVKLIMPALSQNVLCASIRSDIELALHHCPLKIVAA